MKRATIEKAKELVALVEDSGKLKGKNLDAKIAAIIIVAGSVTNHNRGVKQAVKTLGVELKDVNKCYKIVKYDIASD